MELPLALGVDYWWDARRTDLIGLNGADVASWACRITGSTFSEAAPNQPLWHASHADFANAPCVQFDRTNSERLVWADANALAFLSDGTGGTCVVVDNYSSSGGMFCNGGTTSPSLSGLLFPNKGPTNQGCIVSNSSGSYVANFNVTCSRIPEVVTYRYETGASPEIEVKVQGAVGTAAAFGTPATGTSFSSAMGKQGNAAHFVDGLLCQVLLWRRYLSSAERDAVIAWAQNTFGVS